MSPALTKTLLTIAGSLLVVGASSPWVLAQPALHDALLALGGVLGGWAHLPTPGQARALSEARSATAAAREALLASVDSEVTPRSGLQ